MSMIGDNANRSQEINDQLTVDYAEMAAAIAELEEAAALLPRVIETKEQHDAVADMIAKARGQGKNVEAGRVAEKEPYLKAERAVDGFFRPLEERTARIQTDLKRPLADYLRRKEEEARQERERQARIEREKAEAIRRAEEQRRREAEDAKREATKAKHTAVADTLATAAAEQEGVAATMEQAAAVKPAELARTRSDLGTVSTLKEVWTFAVEDFDAIDLNKIAPYIKREAIEQAIRAAVKIGLRELPGVRIYQTKEAAVR